jgi:type III pantothenate kinase
MSGRRLVAVDIGNSRVKLGLFDRLPQGDSLAGRATTIPEPTWTTSYATQAEVEATFFSQMPPEGCNWLLCSVNSGGSERLTDWIRTHRPADELRVLGYRDLPLEVHVEAPERVGLDRLCAAVAANALRRRERAAIVVTSGTAVTVNLVDASGAFLGGAILAGYRMQAEALFQRAEQLPLVQFSPASDPPPAVGTNTDQAIQSGLFWGSVGAVRELIDQMARRCRSEPEIFVTGGDVQRLAATLGGDVRFVPDLVLTGIAIAAATA